MCQALQLIFFVEDFSAICPIAIEAGAGFGAFLDVIENEPVEFAVSVQAHTCKFLVKVVITGSILGSVDCHWLKKAELERMCRNIANMVLLLTNSIFRELLQ
jgi:hypothetical protein